MDIDRLVDEIVKRVQDRLLTQGLKTPETAIRPELNQVLRETAPVDGHVRANMIDHTLLKPDATETDVKKLCDEARQHKFATVCVNSAFVAKAAEYLKGSSVKPIAVVGFPLGAAATSSKAFEAREAIKDGAREIDMVINVGELKSTHYSYVLEDIRAVVEASKPYPVKVILETALLDLEQKTVACALSKAAGAAYVKTSTGFGPGGATVEDIALMRKIVGPEMGVKASGGIRTTEDAEKMIRAGASRIGASSSVSIVQNARKATAKGEETSTGGRKPFTGLPYRAENGNRNGNRKPEPNPNTENRVRTAGVAPAEPNPKKPPKGGGY